MKRHGRLLIVLAVGGCRPAAAPAPAPAPQAVARLPVSPAPLTPAERVESPDYTRWAKAAVGTVVTLEEATDVDGKRQSAESTYRLAERTDDALVVEVSAPTVGPDGTKTDHPPLPLRRVRWVAKPKGGDLGAPPGSYATGNETVTVRGKAYPTKWYKAKGHVEAGDTETQIWYSDAVPGGLVKSVHRIPAVKKTVTAELVSVAPPR